MGHRSRDFGAQELRYNNYQGRNGNKADLRVNSPKHAFIYMLTTGSLDDAKFIFSLESSLFSGLFYVILLYFSFIFETKSRRVK